MGLEVNKENYEGCIYRLNGISWVWCIFEASWGLLVAFEKYL
jgi:hypothetical protein